MQIQDIQTAEQLERAYPLLKQLRDKLSFQDFISIYEAAKTQSGYRFVGISENQEYVALMGCRILTDFVHGKHLYIDDLVVSSSHRSKGIGAKLLKFAEEVAAQENCQGLRLCTGIENKDGCRFYERNGWIARAYAFKKPTALR